MADWIFQGSPREHDLGARIAASPEQWWGTPRYRDRMAVGDRVWVQVTGPHHPGIYYVATIVSATYEHPLRPGEPAYARWRTDIRSFSERWCAVCHCWTCGGSICCSRARRG